MPATNPTAQRMDWLDGARLAAAFCIIAIHTSADGKGQAFSAFNTSERTFPVIFRSLAEIASTEFYILISLFLIAISLSKQDTSYIETIKKQARRLLVPFFVWTIFYAFFRLYKAHYIGYSDAIFSELASLQYWTAYFVLGLSNYHMHFLPTLFFLVLFHRVYRLAIDYPALGLLIVPCLYINMHMGNWVWSTTSDLLLYEYCLRFIKILTYTGYGFFAYSLFGIWQRKLDKHKITNVFSFTCLCLFIGILVKLIYAYQVTQQGIFIHRQHLIFYAHYLFPCILIVAFYSSQHFNWPGSLSRWSKYSFGMYLIHPAIIDVLDIALLDQNISPTWVVLFKYITTAFLAFSISILLSRIRLLAWTIGLGPIPTVSMVFLPKTTMAKSG